MYPLTVIDRPVLTVVSPFYNEAEVLPAFCLELRRVLDGMGIQYEVILVDDGSVDGSFGVAVDQNWPQCLVVRLNSNAGHQAALEAGLTQSTGQFVVTMDADLQHPPSVVPELLAEALETGADVVYAVRGDRSEEGAFKRSTALWYYRTVRALTGVPVIDHAADFRVMSRFVVDIVNQVRETKVYRLLLPSLGFSFATVTYTASPRASGVSKYTFQRMAALAVRSSVQFSPHPLRIVALIGLATSAIAVLWLCFVVISFFSGSALIGWPSLMSVVLVLGGITLFSLGVIGEYIGEIYEMVKGRPHFIIRSVVRPDSGASTVDESST